MSTEQQANMTPAEFAAALRTLGWKQSDLARRLELDRNTPSRWANGHTPVPRWVSEYLRAMQAIARLHAEFVGVERRQAVEPGAGGEGTAAD